LLKAALGGAIDLFLFVALWKRSLADPPKVNPVVDHASSFTRGCQHPVA